MENSRSIHGNLRSSTQWKQRNYYFVELTLFMLCSICLDVLHYEDKSKQNSQICQGKQGKSFDLYEFP